MDLHTDMPSISVVIVNYNAGQFLTACIDSALAQVSQVSEVLVVDNASTDLSLELCTEHFPEEPKLKIIRNTTNLGFAAACNIGITRATGAYVLFLNPDCVLGADSLLRMFQVMEAHPEAGMVGGLLTNEDGTEQAGGRRAVPTPWRSFVRAFGLYRFAEYWPRLFFDFHLHKQALPDHPVEVEAVSGALMLVRREAIEDVGLWDEGYFLHCEDFDWCMRFRQKGWKILFVPDAPVMHHKGICSRSRPIFVEWHKHKGMMRFYRKFFRHQYPGVLMWLVALGVWLRFAAVALYYSMRHAAGPRRG
ncbi:dTDP-Rha--alpha-D-GlcNAc-pyrophosphate polyprenol alpha-3-L-rhamnosyltransferase [Nitrosospira lacus]|uniref:dTDP-Rha--alpha-D-GlcNAc-pyrophosphate polyprenol alpha-3-L-rhamnosyltransferase n=1 Tax=Nitrosospira lacus TaxID=1288494 RepID=A0A1W6ST18_9PROT|nr:glycosyltransferase family 2 protein [Nitrosospira lacus]ARO88950.1 dTDP-Rha--alpha-D-GlcNAc-pyrophosphate polyprenol alpha-3-L-rhamnosyltransferase [Nitrosospira lacus]